MLSSTQIAKNSRLTRSRREFLYMSEIMADKLYICLSLLSYGSGGFLLDYCRESRARNSAMAATVWACCSWAVMVAGGSPFWGP